MIGKIVGIGLLILWLLFVVIVLIEAFAVGIQNIVVLITVFCGERELPAMDFDGWFDFCVPVVVTVGSVVFAVSRLLRKNY